MTIRQSSQCRALSANAYALAICSLCFCCCTRPPNRRSCSVPHEGCGKIAGSKIAILLQETHKYYWWQEIPLAGSGAEEAEAEEAESETESESGSTRLGCHLQSIILYIPSAISLLLLLLLLLLDFVLSWILSGLWLIFCEWTKGSDSAKELSRIAHSGWLGGVLLWGGAEWQGMFEIRGFFFGSLFWFSEPLAVWVFWSNMIIPRLCWVGRKRSLSTAQMQQQH